MTRTTEKYPAVAFSDSHLENTTELYGDKLVALDGDIGQIRDFYFEDKHWVIRYAGRGHGFLADRPTGPALSSCFWQTGSGGKDNAHQSAQDADPR